MTTFKLFFAGLIVVAALLASLLIQRRADARFRENDTLLRQRENQLAELTTENKRLSNPVVQAKTSRAVTPEDRTAELAQLRGKAAALRQQTHQLAKQLMENRRLAGAQFFLKGDFDLLEYNRE